MAYGAVKRLLHADWHTALVAVHEGINRLILSWACGAGLHAMSSFEQDTACVNIIDFDLGRIGNVRRAGKGGEPHAVQLPQARYEPDKP